MKTRKKILITPDKFKYTLNTFQVCKAISRAFNNSDLYNPVELYLADGGEGTADILSVYIKSEPVFVEVKNSVFKTVKAKYYYSEESKTAIIDLAAASGLYLLSKKEQNPMNTSTYGTGEMIRHAVSLGAEKILLGSGGSASNDAGLGAAEALGYKFYNKKGKLIKITGRQLINIYKSEASKFCLDLSKINIKLLYDVNNTLYGKAGAAYVYAKQKGADNRQVKRLDKGLRHIAQFFLNEFGTDVSKLTGGGSAGGFGAGASVLFKADLLPGSETLMQTAEFDKHLEDTDLIITGEGKFDAQSFQGKLTGKVIKKAKERNIGVIVICGSTDKSYLQFKFDNLLSVQPLFHDFVDMKTAAAVSEDLITKTTQSLLKNIRLF